MGDVPKRILIRIIQDGRDRFDFSRLLVIITDGTEKKREAEHAVFRRMGLHIPIRKERILDKAYEL